MTFFNVFGSNVLVLIHSLLALKISAFSSPYLQLLHLFFAFAVCPTHFIPYLWQWLTASMPCHLVTAAIVSFHMCVMHQLHYNGLLFPYHVLVTLGIGRPFYIEGAYSCIRRVRISPQQRAIWRGH